MGRRLLLTGLLLLGIAPRAWAQGATYEVVTFSSTAIGLSAATIVPAAGFTVNVCTGKLEAAQIRVRFDGVAPTSAQGIPIEVGELVTLTGPAQLRAFLGIRTGATDGIIRFTCTVSATLAIKAPVNYLLSTTSGQFTISNAAQTIGSLFKVDALPTVASGFGTSPTITAGSTPLTGSVNVGTGAPGAGGVINFNGTAFPSAPFAICQNITPLMSVRCTATTTQLTVVAAAFTASDVVTWVALSSR